MIHHSAAATANYSYDDRDRCITINKDSALLAEYTWLGNAISKRTTTCDYPGNTKPKFKTDFQRDGILRVTKVDNEHGRNDQGTTGYNDLGEFAYTYDSASNPLTENQQNSMDELDVDRTFSYDTLHRLITALVTDTQNWTAASQKSTWYSYDDLGNRISHQYRDASAIGYQHDKANRMTLLAGLNQNYDDAGNQTMGYSADRGTSYVYRYDHHNRLTGVYDSTDTTRKAALTYDALGRRIEVINDPGAPGAETAQYFYDGVNEIVEYDGSGNRSRYFIHGISYVDERLMMYDEDSDRPYYYTLDRMYDVRAIVDRAGAVVERYAYDPYGRPLIRESAGRGDMDNDTDMDSTDSSRLSAALLGSIWDPRADIDDDGDVDSTDNTRYAIKDNNWPPQSTSLTVAQAFSDIGNPFMFQGRPHFALDTQASDTAGKLMLNDHRARFNDPVIGRWLTRDPLFYQAWNTLKETSASIVGYKPPTLDIASDDFAQLFMPVVIPKPPTNALVTRSCQTQSCTEHDRLQPQNKRSSGMTYREAVGLLQFLKSQPTSRVDPSGLATGTINYGPSCVGVPVNFYCLSEGPPYTPASQWYPCPSNVSTNPALTPIDAMYVPVAAGGTFGGNFIKIPDFCSVTIVCNAAGGITGVACNCPIWVWICTGGCTATFGPPTPAPSGWPPALPPGLPP